jgi:carbamoyltransferase
MLILGLSDSHEASAVLIEDGKILAAVSEERFTRRKRQQGFPYKSIEYLKEFIRDRKIDKIYVAGKYGRALFRLMDSRYARTNPAKDILSLSSQAAYWAENIIATTPFLREIESIIGLYAIKRKLLKSSIKYLSAHLLDHHYSHIISALSGMDSDTYLAVSLDAYGDGKSGVVINVENKKIVRVKQLSYKNSIAQFYAHICAYLGFPEGEEGKVMALAAFGRDTDLTGIFSKFFRVGIAEIRVEPRYKAKSFSKLLRNYPNEDVAFALQKTAENIAVKFIKNCILENNCPDLFLCGGFFANIKVNQRLHETKLFKHIFVFPHMGDGGIAFVSAMYKATPKNSRECLRSIEEARLARWEDVYLGPEYDKERTESMLNENSLDYSEEFNIAGKVAYLLASGKTVALFNGRMEYGPRALGNRSILYQTADKSVNDWLNKKLSRPGYMPFAPVTLFEFKDICYKNINGAEHAAKFMTIALDCTEWMKQVSPGVVHVDGTARPQLLKEEDNPGYYKILKEYQRITGIPSLINTSFNMHQEPIVCSPEEAIRTFLEAELDYLAINRFLVKNPKA